MTENSIAKRVLADLDTKLNPLVRRNVEIVARFTEELQNKFNLTSNTLKPFRGSSIMHGGSAYESLAVKEKADFDVIIVLGKPLLSENFVIERDNNSGFFTLFWKSADTMYLAGRHTWPNNKFRNTPSYLAAEELQGALFNHLEKRILTITIPNATVRCRRGLASLDVEIQESDGHKISIDLAPQIACHSWGQCPDQASLGDLPLSLRRYIDTLNRNRSPVMFFSPCVPSRHQGGTMGSYLCNSSFSQLEKKFLTSNTEIRDMVRLVKFVADRLEWKEKYALKSFYIKRVSIKYSDHLQNLELWDGYKAILKFIMAELLSGTIDGYFVRNQETYRQKPEKIQEFRQAISAALKLSATQIECLEKTD